VGARAFVAMLVEQAAVSPGRARARSVMG
jgi:hypothetical protein